jgi:hypothetical protein
MNKITGVYEVEPWMLKDFSEMEIEQLKKEANKELQTMPYSEQELKDFEEWLQQKLIEASHHTK